MPAPAAPPADIAIAELRGVVDDLADAAHAIGQLMLEVAPACLSDADVAHVLAPLCDKIGEDLDCEHAAGAGNGRLISPPYAIHCARLRSAGRMGCVNAWGIAVVAAGSAIVGGLPIAWLARPVRIRPSDQPEPMLELATLYPAAILGDHAERQREERRSSYVMFVESIESAFSAARGGAATLDQRRSVSHALGIVALIGPDDVVEAAQQVATLVNTDQGCSSGDVDRARDKFLAAARKALEPPAISSHAG